MSHVAHVKTSGHRDEWVILHEWVRAHVWMSRVTGTHDLCQRYEGGLSYVWMSHVAPTNESCHSFDLCMSHIWIHYVTQIIQPYPYECVMPHIRTLHVTLTDEKVTLTLKSLKSLKMKRYCSKKFSKVGYIVIQYSKFSIHLPFEKCSVFLDNLKSYNSKNYKKQSQMSALQATIK